MTKKIIAAIDKEIQEDTSHWLEWYPQVFKDLKSTEPASLMELEPYDERENALFTQGYIHGLKEAKRIVEAIEEKEVITNEEKKLRKKRH